MAFLRARPDGSIVVGNTVINSTAVNADNINWAGGDFVVGNTTVNSTSIVIGNSTVNTTYMTSNFVSTYYISTPGISINSTTITADYLSAEHTTINGIAVSTGNGSDYAVLQYTGLELVAGSESKIKVLSNTNQISVTTGTISSNITFDAFETGNGTVYSQLTTNTLSIVGTDSNTTITPATYFVGNATSNVSVNSTSVAIGGALIQANNGYSRLTNGLLIQWGNILANTSSGDVTFPVAYNTIFQAYVTPASVTYNAGITSINATAIEVRSEDVGVAAELIRWFAVGV